MKRLAATIESRTLDVPIAAFAGLAVAFLFWVIPSDLLGALVQASGVASVLPAAAPPLGGTARLALGGLGALLAFALAFAALRLAERIGAPRPVREEEPEPEIRVRRRDIHPDAPAPRPIMASRDFGEPLPQRRRPIWEQDDAVTEEVLPEAEEPVEPEVPVVAEEPLVPEIALVESQPPAPAAEIVAPMEPKPAAAPAQVPDPGPRADADLAVLMARLEAGLSKRTAAPVAAPAPVMEPVVPTQAERPQEDRVPAMAGAPVMPNGAAGDDRLQSAIASLQRLASRQH